MAQGISHIDSPAGLGLELRSYQKEGLAWLQFLRQQKLSGILADDMGPVSYTHLLDTSVILKWLQDTYQCEVVTFTADLGQGEELEAARPKAIRGV